MKQIVTLTADERGWLMSDPEFAKFDVRRKVLRIIDQLTAALESAEREHEAAYETWGTDMQGEIARSAAAESRAEALQARVAELEAENAALRFGYRVRGHKATELRRTARIVVKRARAAEAELATAKARVAELEAEIVRLVKSSAAGHARAETAEAELADLRGRVPHTHPTDAALKLDLERLQAGMAELETDRNEWVQVSRDWRQRAEAAETAQRELRDLRGRVERAKAQLTLAFGAYVPSWPQGAVEALEALRGR